MMTSHDRLFDLLRCALWQTPLRAEMFASMSVQQWEALYKLASRQGVLAISYDALMTLPQEARPPRELKITWACNTEKIEKYYKRQSAAAKNFLAICHEHGLQPIMMKGITLSRYYPVANHRQCGDIDIYTGAQYDLCNDLMRGKGVEVDTSNNEKHAEFIFELVPVENHVTFVDVAIFKIDRILEQYLVKASRKALEINFAGFDYHVLPPTADALFLLRHTARHLERGIGLRHICDWALFVKHNSDQIDWQEFNAMVRELRLERCYAIMNGITCDNLGLDPKLLPPFERYNELQSNVLEFIMRLNDNKIHSKNPFTILWRKYQLLLERRWILRDVLRCSFAGHVWRSICFHIKHPKSFLAKEK